VKKRLECFGEWKAAQQRRKREKYDDYLESFLAPETYKNLRIAFSGFFCFAEASMRLDSNLVFVPMAFSNTSVLEASFSTHRHMGADNPASYTYLQMDVMRDAKLVDDGGAYDSAMAITNDSPQDGRQNKGAKEQRMKKLEIWKDCVEQQLKQNQEKSISIHPYGDPTRVGYANKSLNVERLSSFTAASLRQYCSDAGLAKAGAKSVLAGRLVTATNFSLANFPPENLLRTTPHVELEGLCKNAGIHLKRSDKGKERHGELIQRILAIVQVRAEVVKELEDPLIMGLLTTSPPLKSHYALLLAQDDLLQRWVKLAHGQALEEWIARLLALDEECNHRFDQACQNIQLKIVELMASVLAKGDSESFELGAWRLALDDKVHRELSAAIGLESRLGTWLILRVLAHLSKQWFKSSAHKQISELRIKKFGHLANFGEVDDISETQRLVGWAIYDSAVLYKSEGYEDEAKLRFMRHLTIKHKEAVRDEEYLAKYYDESMLALNQGGLTLVSTSAFPWAMQMLQTVRKSFTMETMRVEHKEALIVATKNLSSNRQLKNLFRSIWEQSTCGGQQSISWQEADHLREQLTLKVFHCWSGIVVKDYKLKFAGRLSKKAQDTSLRTRLKVEEKQKQKRKKANKSNDPNKERSENNQKQAESMNNAPQHYIAAEYDAFWDGISDSEWPDHQEEPEAEAGADDTQGPSEGKQEQRGLSNVFISSGVTTGENNLVVGSQSETTQPSTPIAKSRRKGDGDATDYDGRKQLNFEPCIDNTKH
jgi:hypothetical protein